MVHVLQGCKSKFTDVKIVHTVQHTVQQYKTVFDLVALQGITDDDVAGCICRAVDVAWLRQCS